MTVRLVVFAAIMALGIAGCGGTAPDGAAKKRISNDSLGIITTCSPDSANDLDIEEHVDHLVAAAEKAGDSKFTLGKFHSMQDVLLDVADYMHDQGCAPTQERRLRDAAS